MLLPTDVRVSIQLMNNGVPEGIVLETFDDAPLSVQLAVAELRSVVVFELLKEVEEV